MSPRRQRPPGRAVPAARAGRRDPRCGHRAVPVPLRPLPHAPRDPRPLGITRAGHRDRRRGRCRRPADAAARLGQARVRDDARSQRRDPALRVEGRGRRRIVRRCQSARPRRLGRRARQGDDHPQGRAVDQGRPAAAARQGPASAARQVARSDRHRRPLPPALRRPDRQRGGPAGVRDPPRAGGELPPDARRRGFHRGRDADPARRGRRRPRQALRHPPQHARHGPVPADRARTAPQAPDRRWHGAGVRDGPHLPQRGHLPSPQSRVHDDGAVPGVRRRLRHDGHHRTAHRPGRPRRARHDAS